MSRRKCTEEDIRVWKELLDTGMSRGDVAKKFGLSKSLVARYTAGYKPSFSARERNLKIKNELYMNIAKACDGRMLKDVAKDFGVTYQVVQKARLRFPELCNDDAGYGEVNMLMKDDVIKCLRKGMDEYEIISAFHCKYGLIKKSDIQRIRKLMPKPRIGFMGMQV